MFRSRAFRGSSSVAPFLVLFAVACGSSNTTSANKAEGPPVVGVDGSSSSGAAATTTGAGATGAGSTVGGETGGTGGGAATGTVSGDVGSTSGGASGTSDTGGPTTAGAGTSGASTGSAGGIVTSPGTSAGSTIGTTGFATTTGGSTGTTGFGTTTGVTTGSVMPPPSGGLLTAGVWDDNRNYPWFTAYRNKMYQSQIAGLVPLDLTAVSAAHDANAAMQVPHATLDVSFVIDTTGSMADEIAYLQAEFLAISTTINQRYPNAAPHWSVILYRDVNMGDEYTTRSLDFQSDANAFQSFLAAQSAGGGGDIPEAPDVALALVPQQHWRTDAGSARMLFWVADAPHHAANAGAMATAFTNIQTLGVHVYPIAASGVDELTELTMRSAAQLTGGRYMFLTNDSGIGGDHKEPTIPCYFVTKLNDAMLRMVDVEMTGVYREPTASEIIRTAGNPQAGMCITSSGQTVQAF